QRMSAPKSALAILAHARALARARWPPSVKGFLARRAFPSVLSAALLFGLPMSKPLIIAEKPSVAADTSRALGGFTRHDDHFESADYVVSSAVGHLLEIGMPEDEEVKRGKWTFAHLPAIPSKFALKPIEKNEARL